MSNDEEGLIPYVNQLLTNPDAYSYDEFEEASFALLVLERRIREANYDEVLDDGITSEEFEHFFVKNLEQQGRHWKIEKVRQMLKSEEEENDIR